MMERYRIGVVGASSLLGKELTEELERSSLRGGEIVLLDEGDSAGQITSAGSEASFIRPLDSDSFRGLDFLFFAGSADQTRKHWAAARLTGAAIVDLTYTLEGEPGVVLRASLAREGGTATALNLDTAAVVPAHPVAVALALVGARLQKTLGCTEMVSTLLEPASEHGQRGMDELHQQTVGLLSFQSLPEEHYDAQVAFNLLPEFGEQAHAKLADTGARIRRHYAGVAPSRAPKLSLQLLHAPVFHGYVATVQARFGQDVSGFAVRQALAGAPIEVAAAEGDLPNNILASGQSALLVEVFQDGTDAGESVSLLLAFDNLRFAALNGIRAAEELRQLRPHGKIQ